MQWVNAIRVGILSLFLPLHEQSIKELTEEMFAYDSKVKFN